MMDNAINLKGNNNIEIIDLDPDENGKTAIQNTQSNPVSNKQLLHPLAPQENNGSFNATSSTGLLQDENIGSTTDTTTPKELNIGSKSSDIKKSKKTLALIPIDYLKYCDMKDGKFRVKLNTLNKLQGQNSVFLYNVTKGNDLNHQHNIKEAKTISAQPPDNLNSKKVVFPRSSNAISQNKGLRKKTRKFVKIAPKIPLLSNPVQPFNFIENHNLSLATTKSPVYNTNIEKTKSFLTNVKMIKSKIMTPVKKRYVPRKDKSLLTPQIIFKAKSHPFSIQQNSNSKTKIECIKLLKDGEKIKCNRDVMNTSIDLTQEQDSLVMTSNTNQSTKIFNHEIFPLSVPLVHENHNIKGKTLSSKSSELFINEKVYLISRNSLIDKGNSEVPNFKDSLDCDPLGDLPNIFEPIVTLKEQDDTINLLENTLTEGFRGSGIPNEKISELEKMIQNNRISSPFKVMIPSQYLKYCTKKNGKYLVDVNALKKINNEIQKTTTAEDDSLNLTKNPIEEKKLDKKKENVCDPIRQNFNYFSPQSIIDNPLSHEQCRYSYMKSSAWDKFDPENNQCKGFNEREVNISKLCSDKFSLYLNNTRRDTKKLSTNLFITRSDKVRDIFDNKMNMGDNYSDSSCNDLYFTKKIDILDKMGRKVRTEHVAYNKRSASDDREEYKKQKLENFNKSMLEKIKTCSVVLERNGIVERRIKERLEQMKIRRKLNSRFVKTLTPLNRDISRPTIILNEFNIHIIRLDEKFCTKCNVMFVKNFEDDFPLSLYKNTLFINLVERKLIKITSPSVLQDYFTIKNVVQKF